MNDLNKTINIKMKYVEDLLTKIENKEAPSVTELLKDEIDELKKLSAELKAMNEDKKVVGKEEKGGKTRYFLKDGSVYVIKGKNYRYLYDSKTKMVTYEFANGQVERTFENGLKEIRRKDGSIIIKEGHKDYDFL